MERKNTLTPIPAEHITEVEAELGRPFPNSLKDIWKTYGVGFIVASSDGNRTTMNINRLIDPKFIPELLRGEYPADGADFGTGIPFFEVYMGRFLMVDAGYSADVVSDEYGHIISPDVRTLVQNLLC